MAYIGNTVQNQGFAPAIDYFSGNGVTVTFTLSRNVASAAQMIVTVDNVIQNPASAYTVSGNAISFTSAPLSGTNNIWVEYTSLITTYAAISQSPSVIGDITASGGYLSTGAFGASFLDGTIVDYVTGNGRITVGAADGFTIYNGGTSARTSLLSINSSGQVNIGTGTAKFDNAYLSVPSGVSAVNNSTTTPYFQLYNANAGSNLKTWRWGNDNSGNMFFQTVDDGYTSATNRMLVDPNGVLQFNSGYGSVAAAYGCRAWASFNGTTSPATINASGNISSITRSATGIFVVNMTNAMPDTNYAISALNGGGSGLFCVRDNSDGAARTTSSFRLNFATTAPADANPVSASVMVFR